MLAGRHKWGVLISMSLVGELSFQKMMPETQLIACMHQKSMGFPCWSLETIEIFDAAAKAMPSQNSGWAEWANFTWYGLNLCDIGHQKWKILSLPQLRGRSWGCNIGNTAGSLRISMKVSNPRGFFGGNLWEDDSMLTKFHARHMDLIVFDGEASQPASFHRFSSFDLGFVFFGKSHECFFSLKSCISSSRLFGSKSLSMRTRICMPHVTWCLHQALLPQRQRRVWQEWGVVEANHNPETQWDEAEWGARMLQGLILEQGFGHFCQNSEARFQKENQAPPKKTQFEDSTGTEPNFSREVTAERWGKQDKKGRRTTLKGSQQVNGGKFTRVQRVASFLAQSVLAGDSEIIKAQDRKKMEKEWKRYKYTFWRQLRFEEAR